MAQVSGIVEVITGSMFCGKTEELIRRLRRATIAKQKVVVFKPIIDDRYAFNKVTSHSGADFEAVPINHSSEIYDLLKDDVNVVGIDEAQFFDDGIVDVAQTLADKGLRVIVTGLDTDFRGEPFACMPEMIVKADKVDKLEAICMRCGEPATRTQRLVNGSPANYNDPVVIVGAAEMYEARCRHCHEVPGKGE
ncbi:MAG TPA: thymidine kinase [Anaerolineaceae bacterium]|nr:thymidine kinase [Anaerolineaceae bacterium]HNZ15202.1 thymidine kinase [Anaerolineaceae bacterium]HOH92649.1 thymidine kinase [Anaerolineaceae bacterium]HQL92654.1 thymidine kinase [Anaerolineaceae bacterium]